MDSVNGTSERYVRDIAYRSNFVPLQAPILLSYGAACAGYAPPDPAQPFRYLELGCGSGATLNALAAACPQGEFTGVDFNAANIAAARRVAAAAGLGNVRYIEAAFSAVESAAIGKVDYLACVGTWSWLPAAEKAALVALVADSLRDGGLLFLSFVTLGRAAVTPMWQVLRALVPDAGQGSMQRVKSGIALLGELRDQGARYLQQNPAALSLLDEVRAQAASGEAAALDNLSHNILAAGYRAQLLDEVAAELAPAGLEFCGAAAPGLNDADLAIPAALRARYDALGSRMARAMLHDFLEATLIRTDIFIRNARLDATAARRYRAERVRAAVVGAPEEIWPQIERPAWTSFALASPAVRYVFERLAAGETAAADIARGAPFPVAVIEDAFAKLIAAPGVELCHAMPPPPAVLPEGLRPGSTWNALALDAALGGAPAVQLAAPGLGSCVPLTLPGSLLVADFCANGVHSPGAGMHARLRERVAGFGGIDPAAIRQFADPQFFEQLHAAIRTRALPMLWRCGALVSD